MKRLICLIVSTVLFCYDNIKGVLYKAIFRKGIVSCIALYYHGVKDTERAAFAQQMSILVKLANVMPAAMKEPWKNKSRVAFVTFDDGFTSVIDNALPEVQRRSIPITIFVPTGSLGQDAIWMRDTNEKEKREKVMSADQLRELKKNKLVTVGSHGISHSNLLTLSVEDAQREIAESKADLEEILGEKIVMLSFPHGAYNQDHINIAFQAGYERVFTILPANPFVKSDGHLFGRIKVDPTDLPLEFILKVSGAYRWLPYAYRLKRFLFSALVIRHFQKVHSQDRTDSVTVGERPQ